MDEFVLILREAQYHPKSYIEKLISKFEVTSVVNINGRDELRKYNKPPLFNPKYLVIFNDVRTFDSNRAFLSFKHMFPVICVENKTMSEDAVFLCREHSIPYRIYNNEFTKELAAEFIQAKASQPVSDSVIKTILRHTGLSPMRIITAVSVCEQLGYTSTVVERYIDKWVYPDTHKLIECLLGVNESKSARRAAFQYLHLNRQWYNFTRKVLLDEIDLMLGVYRDKISGELDSQQLLKYIEDKHLTRARVMYAIKLFDKVSIATMFALREFIKSASLMEVVLKLS